MNQNSIRWRLPVSYAVVALLAALALGSLMLVVLRDYYADQERRYLHGNATALQALTEQILQSDALKDSLQEQIHSLAFLSQTQIRLLDPSGNVLADSGVPQSNQVVAVSGRMPVAGNVMFSMPVNQPAESAPLFIYTREGSAPMPETIPFEKQMIASEGGDIILSVNPSPYGYGFVANPETVPERRSSVSVSVPLLGANGRELGVLELSNGPSYGADVIDSVTNAWLFASVFAIVIAALAGWFISKGVTEPVLALEQATRQMERGDLSVRVQLLGEKQQEFTSLANSFNGMAAQVEQTISTLRAFVADAAHELHTPLTALQANMELAREAEAAAERNRYLARAQEQGQRLETLVKNLLDLSRIEARELASHFASLDLIQLTREIGEQFASRAEQTERIFSMELPDGNLNIWGSEMQLRQVIVNLLENALKFTPTGGNISLRLERLPDKVQLTVSDSGIGIPREDLSHLFERFHRARNVSAYPGNGLGLAIVKAIINLHHGQVFVHSEEQKGTAIQVSLPAA